jgi:hypothetical protein
MYKILLLLALFLSGCGTKFVVTGTMCDKVASEPGATIPKECRNYNEKEADKAFNKVVDQKKVSDKDLKFEQEEK